MATTNVVNLDALIPREDLAAPATGSADLAGLTITHLEPGLVAGWLRKPDFQRETANWSPQQIVDLIFTFANGNIIPAIILWQSGQRVFAIDGAHRLSALIAWVRDDYGAGAISGELYKNFIPDAQRRLHDETQALVKNRVGTYQDHKIAAQHPGNAPPEMVERASKMAFRQIDVQWIRSATVEQARDAFFRINQGGTKIDATEIRILRANSSALAIASRAIARGGMGHTYWSKFPEDKKTQIEKDSATISKLLFEPPLVVPLKTLDVPLAGYGYGSHVLPFAFDLVVNTNNLKVSDSGRGKATDSVQDDTDGEETTKYLHATKRAVQILCSNQSYSLGLHPALYFYTTSGEFKSAGLMNVMDWFMELEQAGKLNQFLSVRKDFEDLILAHPIIMRPAAHTLGSGIRTRPRMKLLLSRILSLLLDGKQPSDIWSIVTREESFAYLATGEQEQGLAAKAGAPGAPFDQKAKTAGFLAQILSTAPRCPLCGGLMHVNGMVADHKEEKSKGGTSASANARMVHPLCNSNRDLNEKNSEPETGG